MFIDEKGRLFGKVSVIDILILLIAVLAIGGIYYKATRTGLGPIQLNQDKIIMIFQSNSEATQSVADSLNEGEMIYDWEKGTLIGKLIKKEVVPLRVHAATYDGRWSYAEKPGLYSVIMTIECTGVVGTDSIKISGRDYLAGHSMIMKSKAAKFYGQIQKLEVQYAK